MISDATIRTMLVEKIRAVSPASKVHRRRRFPAQERHEEYRKLFLSLDGNINAFMIRRLRRVPTLQGIPGRLISVTSTYEIRFYFGLVDHDDDGAASEELAQSTIDALAAAFEADTTLGLGPSIHHNGLQMPTDFEDILLGDWVCHRAKLVVELTAANVNCS